MVECKLSLELTKNGVQKSVHAKMGEKDSRKLLVTLTEKGKVFDLEGYEARVSYDDKTYTKATIDGNVVEFILPSTLLSGPGERLCELEISVPGESVLYSPMFIVNVEGSLGAEAKNEAVGKDVEYQRVIPDLEETAEMGEETYIAVYEEGKGIKKYKVKGLGGASKHSELSGRDEADQHPIESISGLRDTLADIDGMTSHNNSLILNLENETDRLDKAHKALRSEFDRVHFTTEELDSAVKTSIIPALGDLESVKHIHTNKEILDYFGINYANNRPTFKGNSNGLVNILATQDDVIDRVNRVKSNLEEQIAKIPKFSIEPVDTLPETDISETTVYLVRDNETDGNLYTEYIYVNGVWECLGSQNVDLTGYAKTEDIPTKTSQLENNSGFITKADIPTDESYELIGQTPLTLENGGNIKLVANGETNYSITTPTVWNFDDVTPTAVNASMSTDKGYYEFIVTKEVEKNHQAYVEFVVSGLEIGKSYNLLFDIAGLENNPTDRIWSGYVNIWKGTATSGGLLKSDLQLYRDGKFNFVAPEKNLLIRYYIAKSDGAPFVGWVSHFNKMYINRVNMSEELTEIYNNSGIFTDVETFRSVPPVATITTTPKANVYRKAPTDKTLTQSDVPADAEITGKKITEVKSYLPLYGKTIANFGDSIFGNARPPKDVSTFLAEKTGAKVLNCAFGGCRMGVHTGHWDCFSMYRLAEAIANNDYSLQDDALNYDDRVSYAEEPLALIKSTDFSTVDILTIAYGTNDFTGGNALDDDENPLDTTTLAGALRYSIEKLLTAYPNLRIFVVSATYRFWKDENNEYTEDSKTYLNKHNKTLLDYNAKLKEVAEEYNLPFIDNYNIGIGKFNRYQYFNANDGTHHNENGRKLIASHLAKELY